MTNKRSNLNPEPAIYATDDEPYATLASQVNACRKLLRDHGYAAGDAEVFFDTVDTKRQRRQRPDLGRLEVLVRAG